MPITAKPETNSKIKTPKASASSPAASFVIDTASLSDYHRHFCALPFEDIKRRIDEKGEEMKKILAECKIKTDSERIWIAVLGCADRRFVSLHRQMFQKFFDKPVEVVTFDITVDHLEGEEHVVEQDCTLTLPHNIFDITYGHVLLKFIQPERQWNALFNSYQALKPGGISVQIMDEEDYSTTERLQRSGYYSVPLTSLKKKLKEEKIKFLEIPVAHGLALVLVKK